MPGVGPDGLHRPGPAGSSSRELRSLVPAGRASGGILAKGSRGSSCHEKAHESFFGSDVGFSFFVL